jgi:hypothetical protein
MQEYNVIDNLKEQIRGDIQGDPNTPQSSGAGTVDGSSITSVPLQWVNGGVVQYSFIWGKHTFDDPDAIFL